MKGDKGALMFNLYMFSEILLNVNTYLCVFGSSIMIYLSVEDAIF